MTNPNTRYANAFVDALISAGLKRVCVTPGSRHSPLVLAFARHRDALSMSSHLDERSAAFFALGMALASDEPAAVVCTSGSAAANFFPAIVEAHQSRAPLLVLTADRPHELRGSGANQTIDQIKLYGDYADLVRRRARARGESTGGRAAQSEDIGGARLPHLQDQTRRRAYQLALPQALRAGA